MKTDDYIKRSDMLKWVCARCLDAEECENVADPCLTEVSINKIPAADVEPKQKWIPVTERLPECEVGAEIRNVEWISHDMVFAGCFGRGGKYRDAYFRTWTDTTEGIDAKDADCWRVVTLPEPPKEEDDAE